MGENGYRVSHKKRNYQRRRNSPMRKIAGVAVLALSTVALIAAILMLMGFRYYTEKVTTPEGIEVRLSYLGFVEDGEIKNGSLNSSLGSRASIERRVSESGAAYYRIEYSDGTVYEGSIKGLCRDGHAKVTYSNGDTYEGDFYLDNIHGSGKYFYYSTQDTYEGSIVASKKQGIGKYTYFDGTVYEGEYSDDKPNGKGKLTFHDGSVYEGDFVMGVRVGKGRQIYANGDIYEGDFVGGKAEGNGVYTFACGDRYEGEFLSGQICGEGKYTWKSGREYIGIFKDGIAVIE